MSSATSPLTPQQWAWEFLRRNLHYPFFFDRWTAASHSDDPPLTASATATIWENLEKLGPWKPRYEPWVRACIQTGRQFIFKKTARIHDIDCVYMAAKLHLDPMQYLLKEWISPTETPLARKSNPFDAAGSLDIAILQEGSEVFEAAFALGLLGIVRAADGPKVGDADQDIQFDTDGRLPEWLSDLSSDRLRFATLRSWPKQPSWAEENQPAEDFYRLLEAGRRTWSMRAGAPQVLSHNMLEISSPAGQRRIHRSINLQFDITSPLGPQLRAAGVLLGSQQTDLENLAARSLPSFAEVESVDVSGTYSRYLRLLDAYDKVPGEKDHGRMAEAIRALQGVGPKASLEKSDYARESAAYARADMLRNVGYRSLAFL